MPFRRSALTLIALGAVVELAGLTCRRQPLGVREPGAHYPGNDGSAPAAADAARADTADASTADIAIDASSDSVSVACPVSVAPFDVCGCGCCGPPGVQTCYYPALGESRDTIPNPVPPPSTCAMAGCSIGLRHLCCADPGPQPTTAIFCANDTTIEDLPRFVVTMRESAVCTVLELSNSSPSFPISGPYSVTDATRGPCDGSTSPAHAIGGLGSVSPGHIKHGDNLARYDVHLVLFFDSGTATADAVRVDVDDLAIGPPCSGGACPVCGESADAGTNDGGAPAVCAFDATYRYGYAGGRVAFRDVAVLSPPASFVHIRYPVTTMPADLMCAPALPDCGGAAIDVGDVMRAFADPDVQQALQWSLGAGTLPFYGSDPRPSDGQAFQLTRDGGGGFLVGVPCPAEDAATCTDIPPGVSQLVSVLQTLDQQQLRDPSCAAIRP